MQDLLLFSGMEPFKEDIEFMRDSLEQAIKSRASEVFYGIVWEQNFPTASLVAITSQDHITVNPLIAYARNGERIYISTQQVVSLSGYAANTYNVFARYAYTDGTLVPHPITGILYPTRRTDSFSIVITTSTATANDVLLGILVVDAFSHVASVDTNASKHYIMTTQSMSNLAPLQYTGSGIALNITSLYANTGLAYFTQLANANGLTINKQGTGAGIPLYVEDFGTGSSLRIDKVGAFGNVVQLYNSGTGNVIDITNASTGNGINITNTNTCTNGIINITDSADANNSLKITKTGNFGVALCINQNTASGSSAIYINSISPAGTVIGINTAHAQALTISSAASDTDIVINHSDLGTNDVISLTNYGSGNDITINHSYTSPSVSSKGLNLTILNHASAIPVGISMDIRETSDNHGYAFNFSGYEKGNTASGNSGFVSNNRGTFTVVGYIAIQISGSGPYYIPYGNII